MTDRVVRIASGSGFWGDWLDAPVRQIEGGPIDYLVLDYLAEVTMSVLQKQRQRDPSAGYAHDFVTLMERVLPLLVERGVTVIANAGGVNPGGCAAAVRAVAGRMGLGAAVRIGVVTGDDLLPGIDAMIDAGQEFGNIDTGEPISSIRPMLRSANAYIGCSPVAEALAGGANIVITGRVSDPGLTLGALVHEFGWSMDEWDLMAAGTIAGHILECGAQSTGGNLSLDWRRVLRLDEVGFPIVEVSADGTFVVTKHPGTGGVVDRSSVTEQLIYEIGDPTRYHTPDVVADFTGLVLSGAGRNRIRVSGARGTARPAKLKVSTAFFHGWKAAGTMLYAWPDAFDKARAADRIVRRRIAKLELPLDRIHTEYIGVDAAHGAVSPEPTCDPAEVMLRIAVRGRDRAAVDRFAREMAPLVLGGPPGATGYAGGRARVEEVIAYWPALVDRSLVEPRLRVEVL